VNPAGYAAKSSIALLGTSAGTIDAPGDAPCFSVRRDDSSRNVRNEADRDADVERRLEQAGSGARMSADDALRLAIKLAVDAGDYDRAAALLQVARRGCLAHARKTFR
jgi:hypothetical protein